MSTRKQYNVGLNEREARIFERRMRAAGFNEGAPYLRHILFGDGQGENAVDMIRSLEDVIYAMQRQMSFLATAEQVEALAKAKPAQRPMTGPGSVSGLPPAGPKADWTVIEQHLAKRAISPPSRKTVKEVLAMLGIID